MIAVLTHLSERTFEYIPSDEKSTPIVKGSEEFVKEIIVLKKWRGNEDYTDNAEYIEAEANEQGGT